MIKASLAARYLLGLTYVIFGLNGFLNFMPAPPPMPETAGVFLGALAGSGYFFPFLKGTEVLMGLLLLTGFAAPFAMIVLAPITINIVLFHAILTPGLQYSILPLIITALSILSAYSHWNTFKPLFK